jgi:hypothetical protein
MNRNIFRLLAYGLLTFLLICLIRPVQAAAPSQDRPTAPPAPIGGETEQPAPQPGGGDDGNGPTATSRPAQNRPTRTPATPSITPTLWLTTTATITPTLTPTMTPTPILSYVDVQVYMDINRNGMFDENEGVDHLWVTFQSGNWKSGTLTVDGLVHLLLPLDFPERSDIQVQIPYLHQSKMVRSPDLWQTSALEIRLDAPDYPVYLP